MLLGVPIGNSRAEGAREYKSGGVSLMGASAEVAQFNASEEEIEEKEKK